MTSSHGRGLLHLAAAVDRRSAHDADAPVELTRLAERGALDFVTLGEGSAGSGPLTLGEDGPDALGSAGTARDALAVLARAAPVTSRIGLVPAVAAAHTDPFRVPAGIADLDRASRGRAGWQWRAAGGSDLRAGTARHGPPSRLRERRADGASQRHPVRVVDATDAHSRRTAGRPADVALVRAGSLAQAAIARTEIRDAARESGRDAGSLRVLAALIVDLGDGEYAAEPGWGTPRFGHDRDLGGAGNGSRRTGDGPLYRGGPVDLAELIAAWHETGAVDGFHLTPVEPRRDLERLVNGTVALLQHRGRFRTFYPGSTLREHLGLSRPTTRYTVTGGAS
ncbi:LLM class flavin-dependent oxidoreductase [Streptomyces sp. NPDC052036]|uniref:LLM class flavin-dependent oxidoreductase n=1 Tax=Streptomyces sp. NPDC052036 TaxID=3155171 RepID=UPI00341F2308